MSKDIEFLIKNLEKENTILKRLIRTAVKEGEYLIAHYHTERMAQVGRQLQTLRNLDDTLYDERKMIERLTRQSEVMLKTYQTGTLRQFLEEQVLKGQKELEELNRRGKVPSKQSDYLDIHLRLLLDNKAKRVKLVLDKTDGFMMIFRRKSGGLLVSIPNLRTLRRTHIMDDDKLKKFLTLGFNIANDESELALLLLAQDRSTLLTRLKVIISIIAFEIFYFAEFQGESLIEVDF